MVKQISYLISMDEHKENETTSSRFACLELYLKVEQQTGSLG